MSLSINSQTLIITLLLLFVTGCANHNFKKPVEAQHTNITSPSASFGAQPPKNEESIKIRNINNIASSSGSTWLSETERDFFIAFGSDVAINDQIVKQDHSVEQLLTKADQTKSPFRDSAIAIAKAYNATLTTEEEAQQYNAQLKHNKKYIARSMIMHLLLKGGAATEVSNDPQHQENVGKLWKIVRQGIERLVRANFALEKERETFLSNLEKRIDRLPANAFNCRPEMANDNVFLHCQVGDIDLNQPLFSYQITKKPSDQWIRDNNFYGGITNVLGVEIPPEGDPLTIAQQQAMNSPEYKFLLMPNLVRNTHVFIPLLYGGAAKRIEVKLLSTEGSKTIKVYGE